MANISLTYNPKIVAFLQSFPNDGTRDKMAWIVGRLIHVMDIHPKRFEDLLKAATFVDGQFLASVIQQSLEWDKEIYFGDKPQPSSSDRVDSSSLSLSVHNNAAKKCPSYTSLQHIVENATNNTGDEILLCKNHLCRTTFRSVEEKLNHEKMCCWNIVHDDEEKRQNEEKDEEGKT